MASAREREICSNFWAYLHWLRATGRAAVGDRDAWRLWAAAEPERCGASVRAFAGLPEGPSLLLHRPNPGGALVFRTGGTRRLWPADRFARGNIQDLPPAWSGVLGAVHPPEALTAAASFLLFDADLRPDDRVVLAAHAVWPWAYALREGAVLIDARRARAAELPHIVAEENATILVASHASFASIQPGHCSLRLWVVPISGKIVVFD